MRGAEVGVTETRAAEVRFWGSSKKTRGREGAASAPKPVQGPAEDRITSCSRLPAASALEASSLFGPESCDSTLPGSHCTVTRFLTPTAGCRPGPTRPVGRPLPALVPPTLEGGAPCDAEDGLGDALLCAASRLP